MFPEASVRHLPCTYSDHCPLLLTLAKNPFPRRNVFCFETILTSHPDFIQLIHKNWMQHNFILQAIDDFTKDVQDWNINTFGNIFQRKKILLARIQGIQASPCYPTNTFLQYLEPDLLKKYNDILKLEEEFLQLKSCINWLEAGDANTKKLHLSTLHRQRRNRINALKDSVDNWIYDPKEIHIQIKSYYTTLFTTTHTTSPHYFQYSPHHTLATNDNIILMASLYNAEIFKAINSFKALKAPGPDGLHPYFYQKFWRNIPSSIISFC